MGNAMSWRPPPPHGTVQMVIEPDVCCTCEACCGRQWDESTPKPDFVAMSESRWSEFKTNVGIKVRSYRKENLTAILLAVGILLGIFVFHPTIGVVGCQMSGICAFRRRLEESSERRLEEYAYHNRYDMPGDSSRSYYGEACNEACFYSDCGNSTNSTNSTGSGSGSGSGSGYESGSGYGSDPCAYKRHDPCFKDVQLPKAKKEDVIHGDGRCDSEEDCHKLNDCNQPDMVSCYDGQCYTGTRDARCTNQPNLDEPGSPELGDGGWCWDGRRDVHCDGVGGSGSGSDSGYSCSRSYDGAVCSRSYDGPSYTANCCAHWSAGECTESQRAQLREICADEISWWVCMPPEEEYHEEERGGWNGGGFMGSLALMLLSIFGGIGFHIGLQCCFKQKNVEIDSEIDAICADATRDSAGSATFTLERMWVGVCKPKGAMPYRGINITPAGTVPGFNAGFAAGAHYGAATVAPTMGAPVGLQVAQPMPVAAAAPPTTTMTVTCPSGSKEGDAVQIQSPAGQMLQVVVPAGVSAGQQFSVQVPAPTIVATASVVAVSGSVVA